jgi:hypothetical protein
MHSSTLWRTMMRPALDGASRYWLSSPLAVEFCEHVREGETVMRAAGASLRETKTSGESGWHRLPRRTGCLCRRLSRGLVGKIRARAPLTVEIVV